MGKKPENRKHRHRVSVTTEDVLECARLFPHGWTTAEIAVRLGVTERAARAAVCWLAIQRAIETVAGSHKKSHAKIYIVRKEAPCDVVALNRLVMRWA